MIGKRYKVACLFLCAALTAASVMTVGCDKNSEEKTNSSEEESIEVDITSTTDATETSEDQETDEPKVTADADELIARAAEVGLSEEDLRGKYDLFMRFDNVVSKNPELGEFRGYVYLLFPAIADHLEEENAEYFFDKLQKLSMREEAGTTQYIPETNSLIVGKQVSMFSNEYSHALNIVHTLMHFVDYSIDGETSIACYMKDGSIKDSSEVSASERDQIVKELENPIFLEGGAVLYESKYYSYATSAMAKYNETVFMTGLEYIFGSEMLDDVFFDHNTDYRLTQILAENGFTNEEIVRFYNGSEAFISMDEPEYAVEDMMSPQEALIRLYENNRDTDYKEDKIFCDIISLVYYDRLAGCPADHDPISELYYAGKMPDWEKELAKKFGVDEDSAMMMSYPMPIFIDGEIKATSLVLIFENTGDEQKAWVMEYNFDSDDNVNYEIVDVNWIPENPVVKLNVEVGSDAAELIDFYTVDNSAAHSQTVTGTNADLNDLYDKACETGNKHGVYIWFSDLVPDGVLPEGAATADHDKIGDTLDKIGKVLELYPENYFDQLLFEYYSGFAIILYDGEDIDLGRSVCINGSYYMTIFVNVSASSVNGFGTEDIRSEYFSDVDPVTANLVCDIWKCTEKFISNHNAHFVTQSVNDDSWNDMNPMGFMYPDSEDETFIEAADSEDLKPYFISREAVSCAENDRLLMYEYVMLSAISGKDTSSLTDECKAKANELGRGLRAVFDSTDWPSDLAWENN